VRVGEAVRLGVNVHRRGGKTTLAVPVTFYLGAPRFGGVLIGRATTLPMVVQRENLIRRSGRALVRMVEPTEHGAGADRADGWAVQRPWSVQT
jgi:hypothetical protein